MKTPEEEVRITEKRYSGPLRWVVLAIVSAFALGGWAFKVEADTTRINERIDRERERFTDKIKELEHRLEFHFGKELR